MWRMQRNTMFGKVPSPISGAGRRTLTTDLDLDSESRWSEGSMESESCASYDVPARNLADHASQGLAHASSGRGEGETEKINAAICRHQGHGQMT